MFSGEGLQRFCRDLTQPVYLVQAPNGAIGAAWRTAVPPERPRGFPVVGMLPPAYPEWLGDRGFSESHGLRFPYVVGEMAHGIASVAMVVAAAREGMLGFLGTAGLSVERSEGMAREVASVLAGSGAAWGANLIHVPTAPEHELRLARAYVDVGVPNVSLSAFMGVTPAVCWLAAKGARPTPQGTVHRPRRLFAKISRPETARQFMAPPPADMLRALVEAGDLTAEEASLASAVPIAGAVTVEADSGGHTDNRALTVILPRVMALRDEAVASYAHPVPLYVGAAGGIGTPLAAAAAFGMGADYILTGSVNQACVESALSPVAREMLADVDVADTAMAAAADMFELGVQVQVVKRGTMFAGRANSLYELYRAYDSLEELPPPTRRRLEEKIFRASLDDIWAQTQAFFEQRDPSQLDKAAADPKHKMALVFRWYLGRSVHWAIQGDPDRRRDYQIWCGPALGGFNAWTAGTFLAEPAERTVGQVGRNLLEGAATILRAQALRRAGVAVPASCFAFPPERLTVPEASSAAARGGR